MINREKLPDKSHSLLLASSFEKSVRKSSPEVFFAKQSSLSPRK
jgi:hypothetical protein